MPSQYAPKHPAKYVTTLEKREKTNADRMADSRLNPNITQLIKLVNRLQEGDGVFVPEDVIPSAQVRARISYYLKRKKVNVFITCQKQEGGIMVRRIEGTKDIDWREIPDAWLKKK